MQKAQTDKPKTSFLKRTKRELTKSLLFFSAGAISTAAWMIRNKQKKRKKQEEAEKHHES